MDGFWSPNSSPAALSVNDQAVLDGGQGVGRLLQSRRDG